MLENGIDIAGAIPRVLTPDAVLQAGLDIAEVRVICDEIRRRVKVLIAETLLPSN
jgi:hydrogenase maturation factor